MRATLALAQALGGQPEHARQMLGAAADRGFAQPRTAIWLTSMCTWAEVAAELEDRDAARILYARLRPWRHLFALNGLIPLHSVAHFLGRLAVLEGRRSDAEEHFAEALDVHQRMRAPFCIASTQLAWGRLLLPQDPDRGSLLVTAAAAIAARHGYRYLQRSADELPTLAYQAPGGHTEDIQPASTESVGVDRGMRTRVLPDLGR
jgi:hypothetical protein